MVVMGREKEIGIWLKSGRGERDRCLMITVLLFIFGLCLLLCTK